MNAAQATIVIDDLLARLHSAIDDGDLPEAEATIESLDIYLDEKWCQDQDDQYNWMYTVYMNMQTDKWLTDNA